MGEGTQSMSRNEQAVLVAAAAALILSLIPRFINVTFEGRGADMSTNAWSSYSTIGMVLILGAAALIGVEALSDTALPKAVPWHLVAVVIAVLGMLLIVLRALTAGSDAQGADVGPGWSGVLLIVAAIALSAFAVLVFRESAEQIDVQSDLPDE